MICICELLEEESATLSLDFDGPFDGEFTPWLVGPGVPLHRDLVRHDHRCPMFEREAVVRYLLELTKLWQPVPGLALTEAAESIRDGAHHGDTISVTIPHYATLQEAQGPVSAPAEPEASADSCTRKGGAESPDTSG